MSTMVTERSRVRATPTLFEFIRTYAKVHAVGAIHELPLRENKGFGYCLRKSCLFDWNYTRFKAMATIGNSEEGLRILAKVDALTE